MQRTRMLEDERGPWGEPSRHLPFDALERGLEKLAPPADAGRVDLIVARASDGHRETPERAVLTPGGGVPGDAWARCTPDRPETQIAVMRSDVARLLANGQELSLFGDNLLLDLDLSARNLPPGSVLRIGAALLEVTPEPHTGCRKFRQRFGSDALRFTADRRYRDLRLRGIYLKVVEAGEVARGDAVEVLARGPQPPDPPPARLS